MSCLGKFYSPNPTRAWPRVEHPCAYDASNQHDFATAISPITGELIPFSALAEERQMILKGNVLQHKNNANLPKFHRYSQKIRHKTTQTGKTWAVQGQSYTNPNTRNLLQVNGTSTSISVKPTNGCTNSTSPYSTTIGGNLVSNTVQNPCTGTTVSAPSCSRCHLTTASNVPGKVQVLCWNPRISTWYPRTVLTMANSGNKWPTNAQLQATDGRFRTG